MSITMFVAGVLYSLDEKWRGVGNSRSFEDILRGDINGKKGVSLIRTWMKLCEENALGEFSKEFDFDPLYGTSTTLQLALARAASCGWIRQGGTDTFYHVDVFTPSLVKVYLKRFNISPELVQSAANKLNTLLAEQEEALKPPT